MKEVFKCAHTEVVPLSKLVKNPKNPNHHPQKQIELLAKIIDYQGQRSPIVVSKRSGFVIKGHGRLLALHRLGWENAAVDFQDYENEAMEFSDLVADNKIAELAEHDDAKMMLELQKIDEINLEMLGVPELKMGSYFEVNAADVNAEWVDMPEFEVGKKEIKLIIFFDSLEERDSFVKEKSINVTKNHNGTFLSKNESV